ncbi:MAG: hypothetical protein RH942_07315 [Kiloniellaceae bacterium]
MSDVPGWLMRSCRQDAPPGWDKPVRPPGKPVIDEASARRSKLLLRICFIFFGLFGLNVLLGKAQIVFGFDLGVLLPDVAEFLLLLVSALFFTLAALAREKAVDSRGEGSGA